MNWDVIWSTLRGMLEPPRDDAMGDLVAKIHGRTEGLERRMLRLEQHTGIDRGFDDLLDDKGVSE